MQFGAYTFVETRRDPATGEPVDVDKAFADVIEQIELADRVGLDVFGLGEHHRPDYAVSAPAVALAAAAARTKRIRLTSAVTVLSSDDPVRVYQQFATLDLISGGRAEIMAGRGSFIESFPLFGYNLDDYDELFAEKLDLLLAIRDQRRSPGKAGIARRSTARASIRARCNSRCRSGSPLAARRNRSRAPARSACRWRLRSSAASRRALRRSRDLYREAGRRAGVAPDKLKVGINGHGFLADTTEAAVDAFFAPYAEVMSRIGRERGWPPLSRAQFDQGRGQRGHLMVGTPDEADRRNPRPARGLCHDRYPHADGGRRTAARRDPALDRASWHGGRAEGAGGAGKAESRVKTGDNSAVLNSARDRWSPNAWIPLRPQTALARALGLRDQVRAELGKRKVA